MLIFIGVLIGIVLTFYGLRIATDAPFLMTGTDPEPEDFEARYVAHPWLAYLHMTPGNYRSGSAPSTTQHTADSAGCWCRQRCSVFRSL